MSGPWLYDRVKDTSTTTGTGTLTLANSAPTGFRTFGSVLSNADTVYYCIAHQSAAEWETGIGTYTTSGTTLARTTVLSSSNSGSAVNFSAGTKDVFIETMAAMFGDRLPEISITGAVTATIDRRHVCSGTSADYTVTLPAASGNYGRRLWFRMAPLASLSKLVTLDGNASETIDGSTTRVMWAGETAELWCDGSNWFKIAGKTIPMRGRMKRNTSQNFTDNAFGKVSLDTSEIDVGGMVNTASTRFDVRRSGEYDFAAYARMDHSSPAQVLLTQVYVNGTGILSCGLAQANNCGVAGSGLLALTAGDYVELYLYQSSGVTNAVNVASDFDKPRMYLAERQSW